MKHFIVLAVLLIACGKANDLPAMKVEADGLAKNYQVRFDELSRRADAIMQRGNAIGVTNPEAVQASRTFAAAKGKLEQLKTQAKNAPAEIAAIKERMPMQQYYDTTKRSLEDGYTQVNGDFDAVESWITLAEAKPQQVTRREVPAPDQPPAPPPPGNPGAMGAGGTAPPPSH